MYDISKIGQALSYISYINSKKNWNNFIAQINSLINFIFITIIVVLLSDEQITYYSTAVYLLPLLFLSEQGLSRAFVLSEGVFKIPHPTKFLCIQAAMHSIYVALSSQFSGPGGLIFGLLLVVSNLSSIIFFLAMNRSRTRAALIWKSLGCLVWLAPFSQSYFYAIVIIFILYLMQISYIIWLTKSDAEQNSDMQQRPDIMGYQLLGLGANVLFVTLGTLPYFVAAHLGETFAFAAIALNIASITVGAFGPIIHRTNSSGLFYIGMLAVAGHAAAYIYVLTVIMARTIANEGVVGAYPSVWSNIALISLTVSIVYFTQNRIAFAFKRSDGF